MRQTVSLMARREGRVYIEGIYDQSGTQGLYVYFPSGHSETTFNRDDIEFLLFDLLNNQDVETVFFGFRSLYAVGLRSISAAKNIINVDNAFGGECNLAELVRKQLSENDYASLLDAASTFDAHVTAARVSRVPLTDIAESKIMPKKFFESLYRMRAVRSLALVEKRKLIGSLPDDNEILSLVLARAEHLGINVSGKTVHPSFNVIGGKTKRIAIKRGSYNCMSIPHGTSRKQIKSRWENGKIVSMDFNAIDYRCIVSSLPRLSTLYGDCRDFHKRTIEVITGKSSDNREIRDIFKSLTYVHFYGGSVESCAAKTGLSIERTHELLDKIKQKLASIDELKEHLYDVKLPVGMEFPQLEHASHPGARLAYFAQTFSSFVFRHAVIAVGQEMMNKEMKSTIIFTVHDEIDFDWHPEELHSIEEMKQLIEDTASSLTTMKFYVNCKTGDNFEDLQ